ncbi:hypothetical protein L1887_25443 [Cichorium endivia]|nr:hypothetical protein L1887_25443 [Cichorium endivia]
MRCSNERISMKEGTIFVLLLVSLHFQKIYTAEMEVISDSRFLTERDTLVSPSGIFELGFFGPGSSENKYVGIWYKKISVKTVVWVANRDHPVTGTSSGTLKIVYPGNLVLVNNGTNDVVWSSNITSPGIALASLDDTGNLLVRDGTDKILWQSFDYPTDTLLPGMKLGRNLLTGKEWHLSSWKSTDQDPALGEFTWGIDTSGYPQLLLKQGTSVIFRLGPWNGRWFSGRSVVNQKIVRPNMVINETEVVYSYALLNSSVESRLRLSSFGLLQRWVWTDDKNWQPISQVPESFCDTYSKCYAYGICSDLTSNKCSCLDETRFVPRNQKNWEIADYSSGCERRTPLNCKNGTDGFIKYQNLKLPDTRTSWFNMTMTTKECEAKCLKNCSCMAYANTDITAEGSGCLLWFNKLVDMRVIPEGNTGQDIFVRMAYSELVTSAQASSEQKGRANIKIILPVVLGVLLIGLSSTWFWYSWRKRHHAQSITEGELSHVGENQRNAMELPLFSFSTIAKATASFSPDNKIGEGGFGPVYKGMLDEGLEIAVKRLSKNSSQGLDEFKNEVIFISKLQHRNLVKLLGCSIQEDEKLLVYEYMPNGSLDSFIFDKTRSMLLDWTAPSCGYMSPEYAIDGVFSIKSDVFSFGVLVLEIVSGKRNRGFIHPEHGNNLIGHAWRMHNEGRSMEITDTNLDQSSDPLEVIRSIVVGLLCVQRSPEDRPDMSSVVLMLGNEGALLKPKQPAFFTESNELGADISSSTCPTSSTNGLTVTEVVAR